MTDQEVAMIRQQAETMASIVVEMNREACIKVYSNHTIPSSHRKLSASPARAVMSSM